jgi:hypothetical protein
VKDFGSLRAISYEQKAACHPASRPIQSGRLDYGHVDSHPLRAPSSYEVAKMLNTNGLAAGHYHDGFFMGEGRYREKQTLYIKV